jgi:crossover junction endodeoxyribonuclease RusA
VIELVLPYPISSNRYWRPVHIGHHITIVPTKEAKAYREQVGYLVRAAGVFLPIPGRVAVDVQLFPKRPIDWVKRAKKDPEQWDDTVMCIDLDNANKVLLDSLNGEAIEDDKWVRRLTSERMEPDGEGRVVVRITRLQVVHKQAPLLTPDLIAEAEVPF